MGNLISNEQGELYNTELSKQIASWAKNYYNEGDNSILYNKLLQKRACCTGQTSIPIPILSWDTKNTSWEYSSVYIPIFSNERDITENKCTFEKDLSGNNLLYFFEKDTSNFVLSKGKCETLYKSFCQKVYDENKKMYGDDLAYYGKYFDQNNTKNESKINMQNAYIDCNCENSKYQKESIQIIASDASHTTMGAIDGITASQNLEDRCSANINKTFKTVNKIKQQLCVNEVRVNNIKVEDTGVVKLAQKCQQDNYSPGAENLQKQIDDTLSKFTQDLNDISKKLGLSAAPSTTRTGGTGTGGTGTGGTGTGGTRTGGTGTGGTGTGGTGTGGTGKGQVVNNVKNNNNISTEGNAENNINSYDNTKNKSSTGIIVGSIIGVILLIVIIVVVAVIKKRRSNKASYNVSMNVPPPTNTSTNIPTNTKLNL